MLRLSLVSLIFLSGCATLGAQTLPDVQASYNEKLALTQDTQFLLNIVRLRYRDTPAFLDVASLTTQQTMSSSLGLNTSVQAVPSPVMGMGGNVGGSMSVTPTTTFSPVRGDDFVKRLVAPVSLLTVAMVATSGWSVARVLQLTVDRLNAITNAPTATGPTPDLPPDASRFITLSRALRALQLAGHLSIGVVRDEGSGDSGRMYVDSDAEGTDPYRTMHELLDLQRDATLIRLTEDVTRRDPESVRVHMRSILGAMFFLSQSVEVPPDHEAAGLVTITRDTSGQRYDWQSTLDGIFHVRWADREPTNVAVKVKHRGVWFYIADDDLESKSTFMLLIQLFNMQAGRGSLPMPLLTIPAGR